MNKVVVKFKLSCGFINMHPRRASDLPYEINDLAGNNARLIIDQEEISTENETVGHLRADLFVSKKVKVTIGKMFETLHEGYLPMDGSINVDLPYRTITQPDPPVIDGDGKILKNWIAPFCMFPQSFQDLSRNVSKDLYAQIERVIALTRWRQNASGRHKALNHIGFYWSFDGKDWKTMPSGIHAVVLQSQGFDLSPGSRDDVVDLIQDDEREPLAHELLREAIDISRSNSRGALLIGTAALEVGIKHYIVKMAPVARPLISKLISPSIEKLLQEIIPEMHREANINFPHFPLGEDEKEYLRKWISQRNQVAHGSKNTVDSEDLNEFLLLIRDLLYLLDLASGHNWAKGLINKKSLYHN